MVVGCTIVAALCTVVAALRIVEARAMACTQSINQCNPNCFRICGKTVFLLLRIAFRLIPVASRPRLPEYRTGGLLHRPERLLRANMTCVTEQENVKPVTDRDRCGSARTRSSVSTVAAAVDAVAAMAQAKVVATITNSKGLPIRKVEEHTIQLCVGGNLVSL